MAIIALPVYEPSNNNSYTTKINNPYTYQALSLSQAAPSSLVVSLPQAVVFHIPTNKPTPLARREREREREGDSFEVKNTTGSSLNVCLQNKRGALRGGVRLSVCTPLSGASRIRCAYSITRQDSSNQQVIWQFCWHVSLINVMR